MKKTTMRLLLVAMLILAVVLGLSACNFNFGRGGDDETYTVKIMDGDTLIKELTFDKGAEFTYNKADLAKAGYDLVGLYTDAALSTEYKAADGDKLIVSADLTVYAKYTAKDFYIYIDYNDDGNTEDLEVDATYGQTYTLANPAERLGYRFVGFERKVNKVWQSFPATGTFNFTEDIEIRIAWEKIEYVTVLGQDGAQVGKYEIAADGTVTLPAVADTATHTFGGYIVNGAAYGEKQTDGSYKVTGATASVTATQKWTAIPSYLLTVNGLYGTDAVAAQSLKTGATFTLPAAPTRDGYVFAGYTVNGQPLTAVGGVYTFTWSANTTVTANWTARVYITVKDEHTNAILGTVEVVDGAYDLTAYVPTNTSFTEGGVDYTYAGFTLNGASFAASGTGYTGGSVTVIRDWHGVDKIYLNVVSIGATYSFHTQEAVGGAYALATPSLDTHYFVGFFADEACTTAFAAEGTITATTTVYAKWQKKATITVYDGATVIQTLVVPQNGAYTLNVPGNTATHTFGGFVCNGAAFEATGTYTGEADLTVMINWTAIPSFDIFFNANDGAFASGQGGKLTIYQGSEIVLPVPTREGYVFGGWYAAGVKYGAFDGDDYVLTYAAWNKTDDLTLTAKWTAVRTEGEQFNGSASLNYFLELNGDRYTYILLTGHSYTFGAANATITLGEGANAYVTLNGTNGIKVGNVKGAFSMTITTPATETDAAQSVTVDVLVKHYVTSVGATGDMAATSGNAYLQNFREHETGVTTEKKPLDVGTATDFKPEIEFLSVGGSKLTLADLKNDYTLSATLNGEDVSALVTVNAAGDGFALDPTLIGGSNAGKENLLTLTFTPKYALKANGVKAYSMTVSLNDGVNVYTNAELAAAFENLDVKTINILRNIKAEIDPKHGYNGNVNDPHNGYEHGVYYRYATVADTLTVNGNYFKIDGSDLPLIAPYDSSKPGSSAFGDGGYCNRDPYYIVDVQFAIFSYFNGTNDNLGQQKLIMNDLYVVGNCKWSDLNNDVLSVGETKILQYSGSYPGMIFRRTQGVVNNCVVTNTNIAYYTTGYNYADGTTPTTLFSGITLNNSKAEKNWGNGIYTYGQSHITLNNAFFGASGGPSIHFDDHASTTDDVSVTSKLAISTDTVFDNYRSGSEGWFVGWKQAGAATLVKGMFSHENPENAFAQFATARGMIYNGIYAEYYNGALAQNYPAEVADAYAKAETEKMLPFTKVEPANALRATAGGDQEFNFILIIKACKDGWNTEDVHRKVFIHLTRIEDGVETTINTDLLKSFAPDAYKAMMPTYACYDNKLYMDYDIAGFGTIGFMLGLYE